MIRLSGEWGEVNIRITVSHMLSLKCLLLLQEETLSRHWILSLQLRGQFQAMGINLESSAYVSISSIGEITKDINLDTKKKTSKD